MEKEEKILAKIMMLLALAALLLMCSCNTGAKDPEPMTNYSFFIYPESAGGSHIENLSATIRWGINEIQYNDNINARGYGTGTEITTSDVIILEVNTSDSRDLFVMFTVAGEQQSPVKIQPNRIYQIDSQLNFK